MSTPPALAPASAPSGNRLLDALPDADYQRLQPHLKLVKLSLRQPLYNGGEPIATVYLPRSGIIALVATLEDGSTIVK